MQTGNINFLSNKVNINIIQMIIARALAKSKVQRQVDNWTLVLILLDQTVRD